MIGAKGSFLISVLGLLAIFLQSAVLGLIAPGFLPDLLLVIAIFLGFNYPLPRLVSLAFCLGLLFDFCSGSLLGPYAGAYAVVFGIVGCWSQRIFIGSKVVIALTSVVMFMLSRGIYLVIISGFDSGRALSQVSFSGLLLNAVATGVFAPIVFWLLGLLQERRILPRPPRLGFA